MDFLSNLAKGAENKSSSGEEKGSDLLGSAKIVAEAAQAQLGGQPDKYDKGKAADAAADLLDAASKYGKLDESQGVGKYVEQAETYLRQYDAKPSAAAAGGSPPAEEPKKATDAAADEIAKKVEESTLDDSKKTADEAPPKPEKTETESSSTADYVKQAEGFLGKASGGDGEKKEGDGGGYGDVLKAAGCFFK